MAPTGRRRAPATAGSRGKAARVGSFASLRSPERRRRARRCTTSPLLVPLLLLLAMSFGRLPDGLSLLDPSGQRMHHDEGIGNGEIEPIAVSGQGWQNKKTGLHEVASLALLEPHGTNTSQAAPPYDFPPVLLPGGTSASRSRLSS